MVDDLSSKNVRNGILLAVVAYSTKYFFHSPDFSLLATFGALSLCFSKPPISFALSFLSFIHRNDVPKMANFHSLSFPFIPFDSVWFPLIPFDSLSFRLILLDSLWFPLIPFHSVSFPFIPFHSVSFIPFHSVSTMLTFLRIHRHRRITSISTTELLYLQGSGWSWWQLKVQGSIWHADIQSGTLGWDATSLESMHA